MPESPERIGVGVLLNVEAGNSSMKRMFSTIRNVNGVSHIYPYDAHITIIDSRETEIEVLSERDKIGLARFRNKAGIFMAGLDLARTVLTPEGNKLKPYSSQFGIQIKEHDLLLGFRRELSDLASETLDVRIGDRDYEPHLSVAYKVGKKRSKFPESQKIPSDIYLTGFKIDERRAKNYDTLRARSKQRYRNNSRSYKNS